MSDRITAPVHLSVADLEAAESLLVDAQVQYERYLELAQIASLASLAQEQAREQASPENADLAAWRRVRGEKLLAAWDELERAAQEARQALEDYNEAVEAQTAALARNADPGLP